MAEKPLGEILKSQECVDALRKVKAIHEMRKALRLTLGFVGGQSSAEKEAVVEEYLMKRPTLRKFALSLTNWINKVDKKNG